MRALALVLLAATLACERRPPAPSAPAPTSTPTSTATPTATATSTSASTSASTSTSAPTSTATPTATSTPTSTATPTAAPAAAPSTIVAPPAPLLSSVALEPAGPRPLSFAAETVVDPAATFQIELAFALADGRLVLLDGSRALVASVGTREVGARSTTLTLVPAAPLVPASRYVLRLEGVSGRDLHDGAGHAYSPVTARVLVAGAPPAPPPKPAASRRRKRR